MSLKSYLRDSVVATNLNVSDQITVSAISGNALLTSTNTLSGSDNSHVFTPSALKKFLTTPTSLGLTNPSTGAFTSITATTISGAFLASSSEALSFTPLKKVITPAGLSTVMKSPPIIGSGNPNQGHFTSITFGSLTGKVIADIPHVVEGTDNTTVVTPSTFYSYMQSPITVGDGSSSANFNTLTANTVALSNPLSTVSGGTGRTTYTKGSTLIGTDAGSLQTTSVATADGFLLTADPTGSSGVTWTQISSTSLSSGTTTITPATNTEAINSSITNKALVPSNQASIFANAPNIGGTVPPNATFVNATVQGVLSLSVPLPVSSGGTSLSVVNKGDIVCGTSSGYGRLTVGPDGYILQANSQTSTGLKWVIPPAAQDPANITEVVTALPLGYQDYSLPMQTGPTTFSFAYIRAKSKDNTSDIYVQNASVNFTTLGANGIAQSNSLTGTISSSGTTITGTNTNFTTNFQVGDVIFASGAGAVVQSIASTTSLTTLTPLSVTNVSYKRGGLAPRSRLFLYSAGNNLYLSTRSDFAGDSPVDMPGSARQVPLITFVDASLNPLGFIDISSPLDKNFNKTSDPVYSNGTYVIPKSYSRDSLNATDIYIQEPVTLSFANSGLNGLETAQTISGTVSISGTTMTGSNSSFLTDLSVGDYITTSNTDLGAKVVSISSNTSAILDRSADNGGLIIQYTLMGTACIAGDNAKFGSTSLYCPGSITNYLKVNNVPYLYGPMTMECWAFPTISADNCIFGSSFNSIFDLYIDPSNYLRLSMTYDGASYYSTSAVSSQTYPPGQWYHIALVFTSTSYNVYVNGILSMSVVSKQRMSGICYQNGLRIGSSASGRGFIGYFDEFRMSNVARYSANFAPQGSAFSNDSSTVALCHMESSNYINPTAYNYLLSATMSESVVRSGQNVNWSTNGNASISNQVSKFGSTSARLYRATNDQIKVNMQVNRFKNWTIEFFFYPIYASGTLFVPQYYDNSVNFTYNYPSVYASLSTQSNFWDICSNQVVGSFALNTWNHFALYYDGYSYKCAINGAEVILGTSYSPVNMFYFCNFFLGVFDGFIDEFRYSNTDRYNGSFTPPSAAFTPDSNTLSLNHFESTIRSDGLLNYSAFHGSRSVTSINSVRWIASSVTPISTSTSKYGIGSLVLSNYLGALCQTGYNVTGSWTLEFFVSVNSSSGTFYAVSTGQRTEGAFTTGLWIYFTNNTMNISLNLGNNKYNVNAGTLVAGFNHVAITYVSGVGYYFYLGGALVGNTNGPALPPNTFNSIWFGYYNSGSSTFGYIDEFQLSNTVRYSGSLFSPPLAELSADDYTLVLQHFNSNNLNADLSPVDLSSCAMLNGAFLDTSKTKYGSKSLAINGGFACLNTGISFSPIYYTPWTVEFWYYAGSSEYYLYSGTTPSSSQGLIMRQVLYNSSYYVQVSLGNNGWNFMGTNSRSSAAVNLNAWNHCAICYDSTSNTCYIALNGVVTAFPGGSLMMDPVSFANPVIGTNFTGDSKTFWMSDLRISMCCRYNASYTAPTSALTADSTTLYLNNFGSSASANGFYSSASASLSLGWMSATSFTFSRNGRLIAGTLPSSLSSDWTIEVMVNLIDYSGNSYSNILSTTGYSLKLDVSHNDSNKLKLTLGTGSAWGTGTLSSSAFPLNAWTHVAIVYVSSTTAFTVYVNGTSVITSTATSPTITGLQLGYAYGGYLASGFYGNMTELRVSNSVRYNSGFTSPTSQFTSDTNTVTLLHLDYPVAYSACVNDLSSNASTSILSGSWTLSGKAFWTSAKGYIGSQSLFINSSDIGNSYAAFIPQVVRPDGVVMTAWILISPNTNDGVIVSSGYDNNSWYLFYSKSNQSMTLAHSDNGGWSQSGSATNTMPFGSWVQLSLSYSPNSGYKVFVNGTNVISMSTYSNFGSRFVGYRFGTHFGSSVSTDRITMFVNSVSISNSVPTYTASTELPSASSLALSTLYTSSTSLPNKFQVGESVSTTTVSFPMTYYGTYNSVSSSITKIGSQSVYIPTMGIVNPNYILPDTWTIEGWAFLADFNNNDYYIFYSQNGRIRLYVPNNSNYFQLQLQDYNGNIFVNSNSSTVFAINTWTHLAITYTGSSYLVHQNGTVIINVSSTTSLHPSTFTELKFGNNSNYWYLNGVRVSSTARYSTSSFTPYTSMPSVDSSTILQNTFGGSSSGPAIDSMALQYSGAISRLLVPGNAVLYLYALGHRSLPGYLVSTRNMFDGDASPIIPSGYGSIRQLPYVFPTKADSSLYNISWDKNLAMFFEDTLVIPRSLSPIQAYINQYNVFQLSLRSLIGNLSRLSVLKIDNIAGSVGSLTLGPDHIYNYIMAFSNSPGGCASETHSIPLNSSQSMLVQMSNTSSVLTFSLLGFYVTEI